MITLSLSIISIDVASNLTSLSIFELNDLKNKYSDINYSSIEIDSAIQKIFSFPLHMNF